MFKLDEDFLESVGLAGMPQAEKEAFLTHLQDELETEVGKKMIEGLDDEQLKEFSEMAEGEASDADLTAWMMRNRPNYRRIVEEVMVSMRKEIEENKEKLLGVK